VAGSCRYGDESAGFGATELVSLGIFKLFIFPESVKFTHRHWLLMYLHYRRAN
jgi:hypothetical protein